MYLGVVICWPSTARRLNLGPASSMIRLLLPVKQSLIFLPGWDILLDGECDVSISKASEILAGCIRLEKENWRQACWELQNWFSSMQLDSTLSATARPFQPQATLPSSRKKDGPWAYPIQGGFTGVVLHQTS